MKMKYIFGVVLASLLMTSCSQDLLDTINKHEADATNDVVPAPFQLTDVEVATAFSVVNGAYAWYVSSYTEQLMGTGNNQLMRVETRNIGETASAATFNNEWNSTYSNLYNLYLMIQKTQKGGKEEAMTDVLGQALVLYALNWSILTDLHGDIPFSECFKEGVSAPKVESQESIYAALLKMLDEAMTNLKDNKGKNAGAKDLIYGGDNAKWLAFAHALKARLLFHTYNVNKEVLSQVIAEANAALEGGFAGCYLDVFDGKTQTNSWTAYQWSRYYVASSKTVYDLMVARKDPRADLYNTPLSWEYEGVKPEKIANILGEPGNKEQAMMTEKLNFPLWVENPAANLVLMSESEIYFILAEAKTLAGQDGKIEFTKAVKSSLADYAKASDSELEEGAADAYLVEIEPLFTANALNEIRIQKYLAQSRGEVLETYNDMRRIGLSKYPVKMTNPNNTSSSGNRWPYLLPYGDSDVMSNPNVKALFGEGNDAGAYIFSKNVWWAGSAK